MNTFDKLKEWFGFKAPSPTFSDILGKYDVVDVVPRTDEHGPFVVVTDRGKNSSDPDGELSFSDPDPSPFGFNEPLSERILNPVVSDRGAIALKEQPRYGELGASSPSPYTSTFMKREYNRDLEGTKGLEIYNKMRTDGVIAGTTLLFKTPVYAANWFVQSASQDPVDLEVADFVWKALTEYMSISWTQIKLESMLMCEFGYYMFEKVWERRKIDGINRIVLKKLAPRHPMDVVSWDFDEYGGPQSVKIYRNKQDSLEEVDIPISKLLVLTLNREANDITGRSMYRPMYKHWYYKEQLYKIDAIQKERHGIGIPVIKLPPNFDDNAKKAANELGRNLRTNERAHVVLPPQWELMFAKLEGQPVDAIKSIEMHDKAIRESVLAGFLSSDTATKEEDVGLFLKASRFIADSICDAFNLYLIPELVKYNYGSDTKIPKLKVRRIGEQADWRVMAFAIRNLVGAKVLTPDAALEARLREEMDLPVADPLTARDATAKTDGTAGGTGLPRGGTIPKPNLPGGNAGNDQGGQS